jgi:hypothetical protein
MIVLLLLILLARGDELPDQYIPASLQFIQNHWSEIAVPQRPTLSLLVEEECPHLKQGLVPWNLVPSPTDAEIVIPVGTSMLISGNSVDPDTVLPVIHIPQGSELVFDDHNITLRTIGFKVYGNLIAGTRNCRLSNRINIVLYGNRSEYALPAPSYYKGIFVGGSGMLSVHGQRYFPTWTRLSSTARINDSFIFVQDLVNWRPGQTIVITTTEVKDARDWHRNELAVIKKVYKVSSLGPNISAIELEGKIQYKHYAGNEYQAEVGLLSRNIVIQGFENDSEPQDIYPIACTTPLDSSSYPCDNTSLTGFGGHIMIAGSLAHGRLSGVELFRMGQTNVLARYPFHLHLVGDNGSRSYITDSSIHRSFFRCISLHQTSNSLVSENVAYDVIGHCYYLEEGAEENNTFRSGLFNISGKVWFIF